MLNLTYLNFRLRLLNTGLNIFDEQKKIIRLNLIMKLFVNYVNLNHSIYFSHLINQDYI